MKELQKKIEQLERRIAEKEDELQLLKDDLDAIRVAVEAAISDIEESIVQETPLPNSISSSDGIEEHAELVEENVMNPQGDPDATSNEIEEDEQDQTTDDDLEDTQTKAPDHEAIMRTIEQFANKKPSKVGNTGEKETIGDRAATSQLNDIRKAMGLNERFLYANELFQGDMGAFTKAVEELNHLDTLADAERMMEEELAIRFQWDDDDETVSAFKTLVSRRFT